MKCYRCGYELDESGRCAHCSEAAGNSPVRILSREEQASYDGITIDEMPEGAGDDGSRAYRRPGAGTGGIRYHQIHLGFGRRNWLNWVVGGILVAAVLGFLFFVALPLVLVLAAVAAVVGLFLKVFQGR